MELDDYALKMREFGLRDIVASLAEIEQEVDRQVAHQQTRVGFERLHSQALVELADALGTSVIGLTDLLLSTYDWDPELDGQWSEFCDQVRAS